MRRAAIMALVALAACKGDEKADAQTTAQAQATDEATVAERRAQHAAAFRALVPLATEAMKLADPVAAARIGLGELRPAPTGLADREALRTAAELARRESAEIEEALLEPNQRIGLRVMRFVSARIHDQLTRHPPTRNDPTVALDDVASVLDELEYRVLFGDCGECERVLESSIAPLDAIVDELTAASDAGMGAAIEDLDRLRTRVEGFAARTPDPASLAPVTERVLAQIDQSRAGLVARREQLASASTHAWVDRPPPRGGTGIKRLPDRLGARALVRRLEVEEGLAIQLEVLMAATKRNVARFSAMRQELAGDAKPDDRARPVDAARCQAAWSKLAETTLKQPGFEDASIDCPSLVRHLRGEVLDDADLLIKIVDLGVTEPVRRAFRRSQDPSVALATGRWSAASQASLRRVMIVGPTQDRVALGRAIDHGHEQLCQAAAALWIHGELGDDETLTSWLGEACPTRAPEAWIAGALARPRDALTGLGIASVSDEPASMVGIDMFYWAPLGLIPLLATPPEALPPAGEAPAGARPPGPAANIEVKVEDLDE